MGGIHPPFVFLPLGGFLEFAFLDGFLVFREQSDEFIFVARVLLAVGRFRVESVFISGSLIEGGVLYGQEGFLLYFFLEVSADDVVVFFQF